MEVPAGKAHQGEGVRIWVKSGTEGSGTKCSLLAGGSGKAAWTGSPQTRALEGPWDLGMKWEGMPPKRPHNRQGM